jgi:hypothetical protein
MGMRFQRDSEAMSWFWERRLAAERAALERRGYRVYSTSWSWSCSRSRYRPAISAPMMPWEHRAMREMYSVSELRPIPFQEPSPVLVELLAFEERARCELAERFGVPSPVAFGDTKKAPEGA